MERLRNYRQDGQRGRTETEQRNVKKNERQPQRTNGINYDDVITDSARYLNIYDIDLILSWTPHEYLLLRKGAQHRIIDEYDRMADNAMAMRYANNAKRAKKKSIFDAEKARRKLETGQDYDLKEMKRMSRLNKSLKGFTPQFRKKGG